MSDALAETPLDERDALYLGRAIAISNETRLRGNRPFGAVIVSAQGEVLAEGRNSNAETGDCTAHAETEALRIASPKVSRDVLAQATLYASGDLQMSCREVFAASPHPIDVIGPALIDDATRVHRAYWKV